MSEYPKKGEFQDKAFQVCAVWHKLTFGVVECHIDEGYLVPGPRIPEEEWKRRISPSILEQIGNS